MNTEIIACPSCGENLEYAPNLTGRMVRCPGCSTEFKLPSAGFSGLRSAIPASLDNLARPTKLLILQIMMATGGVIAISIAMGLAFSVVGLVWPGTYYSLFIGIWAIYRAITLTQLKRPPRATAIMQIVNMVVLDFANLALGVVELILLQDPEVKAYFRSNRHR